MKTVLVLLSVALVAALGLPSSAQACTVSLTCPGCSATIAECPAPFFAWYIHCSLPSTPLQCTGASSCSAGTSSVTCDGVVHACPSVSCVQGSTFIDCGSTHLSCAQCQSHQISCQER